MREGMLEEIFEKIVLESSQWDKYDETVEKEVDHAMSIHGSGMCGKEWGKLRDAFFGVAYTAEKAAFEAGFRYAVALLLKDLDDF